MEIRKELVCWNCHTEFTAVGEGYFTFCPKCRKKCYFELQRVVTCVGCGEEFIVNGEGDYVFCVECNTCNMLPAGNAIVQKERAITVSCLECSKHFKVGARYEYSFCPRCGAYKQLKFNYRHFANSNSSNSNWGDGETDYFDSDMEGAPGFNGF